MTMRAPPIGQSVAIVGIPNAIASIIEFESPSKSEEMTNMAASKMQA